MRFGYSSESSSAEEDTFRPTSIKLKRSKQSRASTSRAKASTSSSSSSESDGDLVDSAEEVDSEEEIWPVGPINSIGIGGWSREQSDRKGKGRARDSEVIRLENIGRVDIWDDWEDKSKATSWVSLS